MAAGYRLFSFWLARGEWLGRTAPGNKIAVITRFYRPVANITNYN